MVTWNAHQMNISCWMSIFGGGHFIEYYFSEAGNRASANILKNEKRFMMSGISGTGKDLRSVG